MEITIKNILAVYLIAVNLITFILFAVDKHRAEKERWRIRESTLLIGCAVGGAAGGLISMYLFRHKTRKLKFTVGVPALLILNILVIVLLYRKGIV